MKFKYFLLLSLSLSFADYVKGLDQIAGRIAKDIPEGRTVVVFNIQRNDGRETYNSVDLAIKLGMKLSERGKKRFTVIDRSVGERLGYEERRYTVRDFSSTELKQLLEGFKADVGIVGEYTLQGANLILENIRAVAVPTPERAPEILSSCDRRLTRLSPQDSAHLFSKEFPLPQPPDSITDYLLSATTDNNFVSAQIVNYPDGRAIGNNCVRIGEYYRLRIELSEDLYLYCFSYDEERNIVYLLYPLSSSDEEIVKKGTFSIPSGEKVIEAIPPAGRNFVKVFATRKPISVSIPQSEDRRMTPAEIKGFVKEIKNLSPQDWSSFRIFVIIGEE